MKIGKTSFAAQLPKNLILATELGTNAIGGLYVQPIQSWSDIKTVLRQLRKPEAREMFNTITIDTMSIAADLAEKYVCMQNNVTSIGDIQWGAGYGKVEDEIHSVLTEITMLGFGLILIAHSKEKASGYKDKDGNVINQVRPDLSNQAYRACNAICDLIGYLGMDFDPKTGVASRWLYTRESPTRYAGSRWQFLEEKIPFGYNELVAAINMALEKDKEVNGTVIVDKVEHQIQKGRPFGEVIEELKNLCMEYANGGSSDEENEFRGKALAAEMRKVFKKDIKLSLITPEQIDLAEELVANIKELAGK